MICEAGRGKEGREKGEEEGEARGTEAECKWTSVPG